MAYLHRVKKTYHQNFPRSGFGLALNFFSNRTSFETLPKLDPLLLEDSIGQLASRAEPSPVRRHYWISPPLLSPLPSLPPSIQVSSVSGIARGGNSGYRRGGEEPPIFLSLSLSDAFFSRDVVHFENFREIKAKGGAPSSKKKKKKKMRKWRES